MDPPPTPPAAAPPSSSAPATLPSLHHVSSFADSVDSSPRSRNTDSWDDPLPPSAVRLRLMCSYGGHIVPRPHDKSLCYVGGDTRIVVVDRNYSLSDLHARLSKTLINGRAFTLKYQLPSEDLDSLISITTDEDLDNMIDEYDRTAHSSSNKPSRIRLFLFPSNPDSSQSIGPILDNPAKSENWFLNALNGDAGMLNRGFSESASVNCLLGLDDDGIIGGNVNNSNNMNNLDLGSRDVEISQSGSFKKGGHDVQSVPDSPMLETSSSFGSTSSSPFLTNLPPIRVHVEDGGGGGGGVRVPEQKVVGIEEQFAQIGIAPSGQKQEESGFVLISSPPPMPTTIVASAVPVSTVAAPIDYTNRTVSDDERSDQGVPIGYLKKSQPQIQVQVQTQSQSQSQSQLQAQSLPPQSQSKPSGFVDLSSTDSVSCGSSIGNAISRSTPLIYQDSGAQSPSGTSRVPPANPVDPKVNMPDPNSRVQMQQLQDSGYVLQQQLDSGYVLQPQLDSGRQQVQQQQRQQQQFIHAGAQYFQHHPTGTVPISAYYPVYPSQHQQQQHPHHHPQLDQQYPVYYVSARQPQAYNNLSVQQQSNISEATNSNPSSRPQTRPNPTMVAPSTAYSPMRNASLAKPEIAAGVYRTATSAPQLVQVPSSQHQQQYVGYSQIHHPSQSVAPTSAAPANYAYEYADASHAQVYYTQPLAPTIPSRSQYQTMTAAGAVMMPEVSGQLSLDHMKQQQQQMRTS